MLIFSLAAEILSERILPCVRAAPFPSSSRPRAFLRAIGWFLPRRNNIGAEGEEEEERTSRETKTDERGGSLASVGRSVLAGTLDTLDGARERKGWGVTREEQRKEGYERAYDANADPRRPRERSHGGSPRAILRYKSKATSFRCNTRGSIGGSRRTPWIIPSERVCLSQRASERGAEERSARVTRAAPGHEDRRSFASRGSEHRDQVAQTHRCRRTCISRRYCGCRRRWPP